MHCSLRDLLTPNSVLCSLGICASSLIRKDLGQVFEEVVLGNKVTFGSVNANIRYFVEVLRDLRTIIKQFPRVLKSLLPNTVPPQRFAEAYNPTKDNIKSVIDFLAN